MPLNNIGVPQVANRAIVPLAIQAGIVDLIRSLIPVAEDKMTLLQNITTELESAVDGNPPHPALNFAVFGEILTHVQPGQVYSAINIDVLDLLLEYISADELSPVMTVKSLPKTADLDGPAVVMAGRDISDPTQVNVTLTEPPTFEIDIEGVPTEVLADYELYLDLRFVKRGTNLPAGDGFTYDTLTVPEDAGPHSVRVLYVTPEGEFSRFGVVATFV